MPPQVDAKHEGKFYGALLTILDSTRDNIKRVMGEPFSQTVAQEKKETEHSAQELIKQPYDETRLAHAIWNLIDVFYSATSVYQAGEHQYFIKKTKRDATFWVIFGRQAMQLEYNMLLMVTPKQFSKINELTADENQTFFKKGILVENDKVFQLGVILANLFMEINPKNYASLDEEPNMLSLFEYIKKFPDWFNRMSQLPDTIRENLKAYFSALPNQQHQMNLLATLSSYSLPCCITSETFTPLILKEGTLASNPEEKIVAKDDKPSKKTRAKKSLVVVSPASTIEPSSANAYKIEKPLSSHDIQKQALFSKKTKSVNNTNQTIPSSATTNKTAKPPSELSIQKQALFSKKTESVHHANQNKSLVSRLVPQTDETIADILVEPNKIKSTSNINPTQQLHDKWATLHQTYFDETNTQSRFPHCIHRYNHSLYTLFETLLAYLWLKAGYPYGETRQQRRQAVIKKLSSKSQRICELLALRDTLLNPDTQSTLTNPVLLFSSRQEKIKIPGARKIERKYTALLAEINSAKKSFSGVFRDEILNCLDDLERAVKQLENDFRQQQDKRNDIQMPALTPISLLN